MVLGVGYDLAYLHELSGQRTSPDWGQEIGKLIDHQSDFKVQPDFKKLGLIY